MLREELGMDVHHVGRNDLQCLGDPSVQSPPGAAEQCAVRCVSHQCVLEGKCRFRDRATLKNKSGVDEGAYPVPHFRLRALGGGGQQFV